MAMVFTTKGFVLDAVDHACLFLDGGFNRSVCSPGLGEAKAHESWRSANGSLHDHFHFQGFISSAYSDTLLELVTLIAFITE